MWWRRRRAQRPSRCPEAAERLEQARKARETSEQHLEQVRQRWPEVREVASGLRGVRQRNHFADLFRRALGGDHGTAHG